MMSAKTQDILIIALVVMVGILFLKSLFTSTSVGGQQLQTSFSVPKLKTGDKSKVDPTKKDEDKTGKKTDQ